MIRDFGPGSLAQLHGSDEVLTRAQARRIVWLLRLRKLLAWFAIVAVLALYAYGMRAVLTVHRPHAVTASPAPGAEDGQNNGAETRHARPLFLEAQKDIESQTLGRNENPGAAGAENRPARGATTDCPRSER